MKALRESVCVLALVGCATSNPPQELVDARAAYAEAAQGPAARYKPDELHEAKTSLDRAEQLYKDDATGDTTLTAAYVAQRRAQVADTDGNAAQAFDQKARAQADLTKTQAVGLERARGALNETRTELNNSRSELTATQTDLAREQQARADAEARAKDAMSKLALASIPVKEDPRGTVITLPGSVLFASGKAELLSSAQDKLAQVADALKDPEDHKITVEGHTDSRGSDQTNQDLSQRRAESVRMYLTAHGVPSDRVDATGFGSAHPVADNTSPEGRANNRRVEIIVKPAEPK